MMPSYQSINGECDYSYTVNMSGHVLRITTFQNHPTNIVFWFLQTKSSLLSYLVKFLKAIVTGYQHSNLLALYGIN